MGDLTKDIPKPLIQVADKPVVEHIINRLAKAGINEFVLITRYLAEKVTDCLGDGSRLGVHLKYVQQEDKYGTGAALLTAKSLSQNQPILMTYGDIVTPALNYKNALTTFEETKGTGVITLNWVDDPWAGGAVHLDESGKVLKIVEKPPKGEVASNWNSAGIFVFEPVIFDYLEKLTPSPRGEYELTDALNQMISDNLSIYPYYLQGGWKDVGTPEDIAVAEEILKQDEE